MKITESEKKELIETLNKLYYSQTWVWGGGTFWLGRVLLKCPMDCWLLHQIIFETKPSVIIECGTGGGGTTLFFANLFDLMGKGRVISIDVRTREDTGAPLHPRVTHLHGDSVSKEIFTQVTQLIEDNDRVMVDLDSAHSAPHVLRELEMYGPLVSRNCFIVVEDTNVGGPAIAVEKFLETHPEFEVTGYEKPFFLTFNPGGYLRRKR